MLSCKLSSCIGRQLQLRIGPGQLRPAPQGQHSVRSLCVAAYPHRKTTEERRRRGLLPHQVLLISWSSHTRSFSVSSRKLSDQRLEASTFDSSPTITSSSSAIPQILTDVPAVPPADAATATDILPPDAPAASAPPQELILDFLPEKPTPIDPTVLLGEPSLESLGLASWWPSGRLQLLMEQLHIGLGLEWYQAIAITTLLLRLITFPLVVMAQRNVANMSNSTPGMVALQQKMTDARQRGDHMEMAQYGAQLQTYMKKKGINPVKNVIPVAAQVPIFMSMFFGLRSMANLPVQSMETGGALWFENLCMADPFYLLPLLTSSTLYLQIRMGADGARLAAMGPIARVFFTVFPFALLPITMNFPCAVTFYWFCTNLVSCTSASLLRLPAVRKRLDIPEIIKFEMKANAGPKKGFRETVRETIDNWRVQGDIIDRRAMDEQAFREAGTAKIKKTYAYDPTKPVAIRPKRA